MKRGVSLKTHAHALGVFARANCISATGYKQGKVRLHLTNI